MSDIVRTAGLLRQIARAGRRRAMLIANPARAWAVTDR
jgi:hypothetical protein